MTIPKDSLGVEAILSLANMATIVSAAANNAHREGLEFGTLKDLSERMAGLALDALPVPVAAESGPSSLSPSDIALGDHLERQRFQYERERITAVLARAREPDAILGEAPATQV